MKAIVEASDFADKTVTWEVTGDGVGVTINERTGLLTISGSATTGAYTVKATSNGDSEKNGESTVTVA